MPVVADRDADATERGVVDGGAAVTRRVIAGLVEAGVVGDVHHARGAEQTAVGVDHGRGIEGAVAVALEEVEHDDDAEIRRAGGKGIRNGTGDGLGQVSDVGARLFLRIERLERQLGETDDIGARVGSACCGVETALQVGPAVVGCGLLDQRDADHRRAFRGISPRSARIDSQIRLAVAPKVPVPSILHAKM